MANSLESSDGGAAELQRSLLETTVEPPFDGKPQSENNGNLRAFAPGQAHTYRESDTYAAVPEMIVIPQIQEQTSTAKQEQLQLQIEEQTSTAKQEQVQVKCSEKCPTEKIVAEPSPLVNSKLQETKEKKPRRRGGRGRRNNNEILNSYSTIEKKEKKGHQYSREMMESLRFEELEEQKKRWVEVYCGLGPLVAKEYDELVDFNKSVPDIDFDPRLKFRKSAKYGEDFPQVVEDHLKNLDASDSSSIVEEEECSQEEDDSDDDYGSIQRPVFMVTGEPDFDSGPPQDGLEYLRRVRWETARIPKVTVAKINKRKEQSTYMPQIPGIMQCPQSLLPLKQWEDSFLADFTELRLDFAKLDLEGPGETSSIKPESIEGVDILNQMIESNNSFEKIVSLASSETSDAKVTQHSPENTSSTNDLPTLSTILKMESAARTSMLKRRIRAIENVSTLSHDDGLWLFALCVAVDCPLDADTSAALRSLLRKCASLRAGKTQVDDEVVVLNILVTISGRYFGQLECVEK
ncbi:hypothetical protein ABFS83_07G084400 [Erythranthe nasuta]